MEINTKILGNIVFQEESIINLKEGLIGLDDKKKFILIEKENFKPFSYLQSTENGNFSLIVINPFLLNPNLELQIDEPTLDSLNIKSIQDMLVLSIVVFANKMEDISVNFKAPIIINIHDKKGKQVIVDNPELTVNMPLFQKISITENKGRQL